MKPLRYSGGFVDCVELHGFTEDWRRLGLDDDDLFALQMIIMANPQRGAIVKGTGGLRKLRFGPPGWHTGKRGGIRVCYVFLQEISLVVLVTAYGKKQKDDLTAEERKAIRQIIARIKQGLP